MSCLSVSWQGCSDSTPTLVDGGTNASGRDAGSTGDGGPELMDAGRRVDAGPSTCPPLPSDLRGEVVPNAEGYHSILFDDDGNIVTAPGAELVRGLRGEVPQPFARSRSSTTGVCAESRRAVVPRFSSGTSSGTV